MAFWSVVQTESQREQVAADFLKRDGFESYLPKIAVKGTKNGVKRERVVALFPSYLFVRIVGGQWYNIRWTIGVVRLLTFDGLPAPISDNIVNTIRKRENADGIIRLPKTGGLRRGQSVRISQGSFADHVGIFDGMTGPDRVRVLIELLGRSVPVSIPKRDIVAIERA
jgi:transcriptional antiterminator RfaH